MPEPFSVLGAVAFIFIVANNDFHEARERRARRTRHRQ
jgi:hypothetical protein